MVEYVRTGLFRHDKFTDVQRAAYVSNDLHWGLTHKCNTHGWTGMAEDKALATMLLSAGEVPTPEILGVIDVSPRIYPGVTQIGTADQLRDLVLANLAQGIFGKIVDGMVSFGAFRIETADATHLTCAGHAPMTYDSFLADFVGENTYILQHSLTNHSALAPYAGALATVRMVNLVQDDGVYCPLAVIKLPQGENIADAFWRPGNLASEVDVDTGEIRTVTERGRYEVTFHDDHPEHAGLMGLKLPHWDDLREINARAAQIFAPIRYQSTDIAITEDGPVVIELNYGGGFDLPQYASGRGMLTPEVRSFFESHGCRFEGEAKKKWSLFGRR
ncbi:sugar-transfer associated ATP-grasp domain-containing protein [Halocynthiibacter namhaensis]|uniref:sugar-transfer associated ATP-grasp domain-containing protein n=1 Tax=Halocynthiibacter namhaensis TaxID=1290553 RepID=UPI0005791DE4|nr:sugar-transfer associated ATP-grasp domain-containing protein [Halocynthiibacter namhaensis]